VSTAVDSTIWRGRPWILPLAFARTLAVLAIASLFILIEIDETVAANAATGATLTAWTGVAFFLFWLSIMTVLLWQRANNRYTLKKDRLEIQTGIFSVKTISVRAGEFADLKVVEGVWGHMTGYGGIIIQTHSKKSKHTLHNVRHPQHIADQIRHTLKQAK
jgi:uncharacterized membrane protein YdbT with pleckstrin-like domain